MSGNYERSQARYNLEECFVGNMRDKEMDALLADLCAYGRGATQKDAGPLMALEFWRSDDWDEETYRESVRRFKQKWFKRTDGDRVEFYQQELQKYCDGLKAELGWKGEEV